VPESHPSAPSETSRHPERARIRAALEHLPEDQRTAVVCAHFGQAGYREVAARLGLPERTVLRQIRAGLRHLRALLDDEAALPHPVSA
jgi:RNA polymerase sigma factor (sigma-70 family)